MEKKLKKNAYIYIHTHRHIHVNLNYSAAPKTNTIVNQLYFNLHIKIRIKAKTNPFSENSIIYGVLLWSLTLLTLVFIYS